MTYKKYSNDFTERFNKEFNPVISFHVCDGPSRVIVNSGAGGVHFDVVVGSFGATDEEKDLSNRYLMLYASLLRDVVKIAPYTLTEIRKNLGVGIDDDDDVTKKVKKSHYQTKHITGLRFRDRTGIDVLERVTASNADPLVKWSAYATVIALLNDVSQGEECEISNDIFAVVDRILVQEPVNFSLANNVTFPMLVHSGMTYARELFKKNSGRYLNPVYNNVDDIIAFFRFALGVTDTWVDLGDEDVVDPLPVMAFLRAIDGDSKAITRYFHNVDRQYYPDMLVNGLVQRDEKAVEAFGAKIPFTTRLDPNLFVSFYAVHPIFYESHDEIRLWMENQYASGRSDNYHEFFLSSNDFSAMKEEIQTLEQSCDSSTVHMPNIANFYRPYNFYLFAYLYDTDYVKFRAFLESFLDYLTDNESGWHIMNVVQSWEFSKMIIDSDSEFIRTVPMSFIIDMCNQSNEKG